MPHDHATPGGGAFPRLVKGEQRAVWQVLTTVMVIGAGLTGSTLALALARVGFEVDLHEQAPRLDEVGAGISLSPNAVRALAWVGVADDVERIADLPGPGAILHFRTGELLRTVDRDAGFAGGRRRGFMQLRRCELLDALTARIRATPAIRVHLGHRLVSLEATASAVTARFDGGFEGHAQLLVGCDGLRSTVRAVAFEESPPRFTGQLAWRCLVDAQRVRRHLGAGPSALYLGPQRFVNRYLVQQGRLVNVVAIARTERTGREGWFNRSTYGEFASEFAGWHEDVIGLVRHAPQDGLFTWALFDRDPLPDGAPGGWCSPATPRTRCCPSSGSVPRSGSRTRSSWRAASSAMGRGPPLWSVMKRRAWPDAPGRCATRAPRGRSTRPPIPNATARRAALPSCASRTSTTTRRP